VAKEIVQSGDWLRLRLDGQLWFDKPPLGIWVTALFYKMFGMNEFSARLFSSLCGAGTVITTYFLGRQLLNRWAGFIGALVLLSSSHFILYTRFGMLDAPLTFFTTLALYFFWLGQDRNRYLIFSGIMIGFAVLTKSFAAFLVFPIIWIYAWLANRLDVLGRSSYWIGVMIAVMIALPWNLYELVTQHDLFFRGAVTKHLFLRVFQALEGHDGNWYFYIRVLVNKYHPWVLLAVVTAPYFLLKAWRDRDRETLFLTVWMFVIFLAVTLIQTKLSWYLLPAYPPLSLSVAYALSRLFREKYSLFVRWMFLAVMVLHVPYSHIFDYDYSPLIKGIAPAVQAWVPKGQPLALYKYHESPAVSFYVGRSSIYLDSPEELHTKIKQGGLHCLIRDEDYRALGGDSFLAKRGLEVKTSYETLRFVTSKS
jgi:4-amino-4-deoxy-L-arabinose transferase-like glycosyltransferase